MHWSWNESTVFFTILSLPLFHVLVWSTLFRTAYSLHLPLFLSSRPPFLLHPRHSSFFDTHYDLDSFLSLSPQFLVYLSSRPSPISVVPFPPLSPTLPYISPSPLLLALPAVSTLCLQTEACGNQLISIAVPLLLFWWRVRAWSILGLGERMYSRRQ